MKCKHMVILMTTCILNTMSINNQLDSTRMLNDDTDSTRFYSANERDVRYESYDYTLPTDYIPWSTSYGGGSSQYPFMPITDHSHTFHSASSSGHHIIEEHVIEEDEENEIDSQDDIDDNENMDEGDDEPLFDIARVNNTEIEYEQDPPDIFTSDQWIDEVMLNNSHEEIDVPCTLKGASQILIDEVMPDEITHSQPPQSTVDTYRRQRRHRGSTSTLPQQSQSDLLGETLGSISEDIDSETVQSESCDAILVHETQSQSETEVDAQGEIYEQCHSRGRGRASRKRKKRWFPQFF
ncbi:hypothetical protein Taro_019136 [Colocasia esculenta]|uniref:Uncharacterized protein n=1 Tax=Colocasia esculenta TaxID=4460 RepID=A0A843UYB3_COLES|nr:hypothetical protein [Colocasia esculenta]